MTTTTNEPDVIRAADELVGLSIAASGTVEIQAADPGEDGKPKRPTFNILGYTGAVMNVAGFYSPVIVDLSGLRAASQIIPALRDHESGRIVGQTSEVKIDAEGVRLAGVITGENADATEVVSQAKNGFRWQASIGASVDRREFLDAGKTAVVNGREVSGPLVIARNSTLKEISFVAIGADGQTTATLAASSSSQGLHSKEHPVNFDEWLKAKGFDPAGLSDSQKAPLKAAFDTEQRAAQDTASREHGGQGGSPKSNHNQVVAAQTETLDQIFAARKAEDERIASITQITAEAVNNRPMMLDELEKMSKAAIEAKSTPAEYELAVLRATRYSTGPAIHSVERKAGAKVIEAAVCLSAGLANPENHYDENTLQAADDRFKHRLGLVELLQMAARENSREVVSPRDVEGLLRGAFGGDVRASGFSTISLPSILSNSANKFLIDAFNHVEDGWRAIADRVPVSDFKTITSHSLTGDLEYEEVGPGGEIKHGTLGEEVYTNRARSYGRMLAITYQDIRNDDLGALTRVPRRLGRGGALKINDVFWKEFLDNTTFFATARGNYLEGATAGATDSRLNIDGLTNAETLFFNQTDPNGKPLGVTPRILLVPNALNARASQLMNSTEVRDTTANTLFGVSNPHAGKFTIVRSSYLSNSSYTGNSAAKWYLIADPNDVPTMQIALLDGREMPIVESASADFNTLGIQMRGTHHFGVAKMEYRGGVAMKGEA